MYRIGEFSKLSRTTIKALRYYDKIGLLKPASVDRLTGYRFYSSEQLLILYQIKSLKQIGLSIEEIQLILSGYDLQKLLNKRRTELIAELEDINQQLKSVNFMILNQNNDPFLLYQPILKTLPECIVYSKKIQCSSYNDYFKIIPSIGQKVISKYPDLKCTTPEYCFIVYLDGEYKEKERSLEFCEAITTQKDDFEDIIFKKIPSTNALSILHKGSYPELPKAYAFAFKWIEQNGYIASDNPRESYIDGIWNQPQESDWLTEIQIPIIKREMDKEELGIKS